MSVVWESLKLIFWIFEFYRLFDLFFINESFIKWYIGLDDQGVQEMFQVFLFFVKLFDEFVE